MENLTDLAYNLYQAKARGLVVMVRALDIHTIYIRFKDETHPSIKMALMRYIESTYDTAASFQEGFLYIQGDRLGFAYQSTVCWNGVVNGEGEG